MMLAERKTQLEADLQQAQQQAEQWMRRVIFLQGQVAMVTELLAETGATPPAVAEPEPAC